jgi:hypothetical protein
MSKQGVVNIKGKDYKTVALRVQEFREKFPAFSLISEIVKIDDEQCIIKAMVIDGSRIVASGHAQEFRKSSQINGTSYVENCETSAFGRALACLGIGGTEFASANEVLNAIHQQSNSHINQIELEEIIKKINKAESKQELMAIYREAGNFDDASLAKVKRYLSDRKTEIGEDK